MKVFSRGGRKSGTITLAAVSAMTFYPVMSGFVPLATLHSIPSAVAAPASANNSGKLALPVVLYLVAVMLPIGFNLGPIYLNLVRLVLLMAVVPLTLRLFAGSYGRLLVPDFCFFLFIAWMTITTTINDPDRVLENVGSTSIEFIGGYVLGRAYIRTAADFIRLSRALVMMIILTTPIALYELYTNVPPLLTLLQRLPGIRTEWIVQSDDEMRMGLYRVQAMFPHPIHYGMFCSSGFALCFIGLKGVYSNTRRYLALAVITFCTFTSLSSGALLPIFMQTGLIAWALLFRKTEKRWLILALLCALGYVALLFLSNRPPIIVVMSYATFSAWNAYWRALIFEYGIQNVWANPWFGIGLTADWVRPVWMGPSSVDNFWLVVAMRYGLPGIALLGLGYLQPLWSIGFRRFDPAKAIWPLRRAWLMVFMGLTFSLSSVHVWSTLYSFVFFLFGAGMWFLTSPTETPGAGPDVPPDVAPDTGPTKPMSRYSRFPAKSRVPAAGAVPVPVASRSRST